MDNMVESKFQAQLIKDLYEMFEDCVVLKNDANYIQGMPDLLVLYRNHWAMLECKASMSSSRQPNQEYYVELLDEMSFAAFICPKNKEEILRALQSSFGSRR
jgi:hypothetical protein